MHICLITPRLPPQNCGIGDYTKGLCQTLVEQGFRVSIITNQGQQVSPIPSVEIRATVRSWNFVGIKNVVEEARDLKPDLIMLQYTPNLYDRFGVPWKIPYLAIQLRLSGIPVMCMLHEISVPMLERWEWGLIAWPQRLIAGLLIQICNYVGISVSQWVRTMSLFMPWRKKCMDWFPVWSNIGFEKIPPIQIEQHRNKILSHPSGKIVCSFSPVGSGRSGELTTQCWEEIEKHSKDTHFVLIGLSQEKAKVLLPRLSQNPRCHFLGYLENREVSAWLQSSDLFLAPFRDGLTTRRTSALAALSHGLPTLSTDGNLYNREFFSNSPIQIVAFEATAIAERALKLIQNEEHRTALAQNTLEFYRSHLSREALVRKMLLGNATPLRVQEQASSFFSNHPVSVDSRKRSPH